MSKSGVFPVVKQSPCMLVALVNGEWVPAIQSRFPAYESSELASTFSDRALAEFWQGLLAEANFGFVYKIVPACPEVDELPEGLLEARRAREAVERARISAIETAITLMAESTEKDAA